MPPGSDSLGWLPASRRDRANAGASTGIGASSVPCVPYNASMIKTPSSRESIQVTTPETQLSLPLTPRNLRALRARAHALRPVVWIASGGPTEGVVRELDRALAAHELVKMHAAIDDREARDQLLRSL